MQNFVLLDISGFFRTLLTILCVYYVLKFLIKLIAPYLMQYVSKKIMEKAQNNMMGGFQNMREEEKKEKSRSDGEVIIEDYGDRKPKKKNGINDEGDYVDFEDIPSDSK